VALARAAHVTGTTAGYGTEVRGLAQWRIARCEWPHRWTPAYLE